MKTLLTLLAIAVLTIQLQGCSVGMALSGKKQPELGVVHVGATRGEVELQLGSPIEIKEEQGKRLDVYEYEIGNEPSAGRAAGHAVLDILTLGLWEVAGSPIEGFQGDKKYLMIEYDEKDIVTRVGSTSKPAKKQDTSQKAEFSGNMTNSTDSNQD